MATFRKPVTMVSPDSATYPDRISNQITATNEIGNLIAYVMAEGAADSGVYVQWSVPKNYVGSGVLVVKGILDGAPGASDVLAFTVAGLARADNEPADTAFGTPDLASATIGSGGTNHSDEDVYEETVTLTNLGTLDPDDTVFAFAAIDISVNDYAGNFLLTAIEFQYAGS